jgi:23S rRNA (pseudouridine1915-N3)-methyltransferase
MRVLVISVGRAAKAAEQELVERYLARLRGGLTHSAGVSDIEFLEIADGRAASPALRRRQEADAIRAKIPAGAAVVVLDERGRAETSAAFAERLQRLIDDGASVLTFAIGGADGHDPEFRAAAGHLMSFGPMTFPHQLVRAMLAEQLYRSFTILAKHPYHRA